MRPEVVKGEEIGREGREKGKGEMGVRNEREKKGTKYKGFIYEKRQELP